MKIKVLLCNCKGLCPSFKNADMNTLPFQVESELDVQYTVVHPQFCGQGAQEKLFKKLLRLTGFPPDRFIAVDIRGTDNDGILMRLKGKVEEILRNEEARATVATQ
jgi:hypothetical protein